MHKMPPLEALHPFVGDEIMQVKLDPISVQFHFESGRILMVEERIEHREADGAEIAYDCDAANGPPLCLHRLLQKPVQSVERTDLSFTLGFQGGASLTVRSEIGPYESGQIFQPNGGPLIF